MAEQCPECGATNIDVHVETQLQSGYELDEHGQHSLDQPLPLRSWLQCVEGNHRFDGPRVNRPGTEGLLPVGEADHEFGRHPYLRDGVPVAPGVP